MGALAAFLGHAAPADGEIVRKMGAAAPHRGHRQETTFHGRCALACLHGEDADDTSLATINGVSAAFTGTLDNLPQVASELERRGVGVPSTTPAAVIATAFRLWGDDLPARLRGVFAVILTDGNRLFAFRDHLGFGPLFYRSDGRGFYAATEAKQVVAGSGVLREPDLETLAQIFYHSCDHETPSALRGIRRVPKASFLSTDGHSITLRPYWTPESVLETGRFSQTDLQARFDELMTQAVTRCLTGHDVVLMSGGIDSPAVAAFGAPKHLEMAGEPLAASSAVYPEFASVDERRYIELAAQHFGIPLHTWNPRANALDRVTEWVTLADGPAPPVSLPYYAESYGTARELGYRSVLTGELAEFVCALDGYLIDHLIAHVRIAALWTQLRIRRSRGAAWLFLGRELAAGLAPAALRASRLRRNHNGIPAWVDVGKANEFAATSLVGPRERWRTLQLSPLAGPSASLEAEEICQAVCGVRARRPWADVDLWEFFLSLPAEVKFPDPRNKSLVRTLLAVRIPGEILDRRDKTVFDEALMADIDYATLRRFLLAPGYRIDGVNYELLGERLRSEDLGIEDYSWVMSLAAVHAFLSQW